MPKIKTNSLSREENQLLPFGAQDFSNAARFLRSFSTSLLYSVVPKIASNFSFSSLSVPNGQLDSSWWQNRTLSMIAFDTPMARHISTSTSAHLITIDKRQMHKSPNEPKSSKIIYLPFADCCVSAISRYAHSGIHGFELWLGLASGHHFCRTAHRNFLLQTVHHLRITNGLREIGWVWSDIRRSIIHGDSHERHLPAVSLGPNSRHHCSLLGHGWSYGHLYSSAATAPSTHTWYTRWLWFCHNHFGRESALVATQNLFSTRQQRNMVKYWRTKKIYHRNMQWKMCRSPWVTAYSDDTANKKIRKKVLTVAITEISTNTKVRERHSKKNPIKSYLSVFYSPVHLPNSFQSFEHHEWSAFPTMTLCPRIKFDYQTNTDLCSSNLGYVRRSRNSQSNEIHFDCCWLWLCICAAAGKFKMSKLWLVVPVIEAMFVFSLRVSP